MRRPSVTPASCLVALCLAAAAACSKPAPKYYPLAPGLRWEYDVYSEIQPPRSKKQRSGAQSFRSHFTVTNMETRPMGEWTVTPQRMEFNHVILYRFFAEAHDGVGLIAEQKPGQAEPKLVEPPDMMLPYPAELGHTWQSQVKTEVIEPGTEIATTETIESLADTITVQAGAFRCLRVRSVGSIRKEDPTLPGGAEISIDVTAWYAADIGAVQIRYRESSTRADLGDAEVTYQLQSMSRGAS